MARETRHMVAILDADVVGRSSPARRPDSRQRLEPVVARHRGRLVKLTGDGARAEFPSAAEALSAAIEFQQTMANADRAEADSIALFLRLGGTEKQPEAASPQERGGGIVVTAALREAVVGRIRASFAELGHAGLGTVERPVRLYEVGWDPADWPAATAAAAKPIESPGDGKRLSRWAVAIAWAVVLAGAFLLSSMPRPAGNRLPVAESFNRLALERRAEVAIARWQQEQNGEQHEPDEGPTTPESAPPTDVFDGIYTGTTTMRADGRAVALTVKVTNGIGSGTQTRLDCGTAPLSLKISPWGDIAGMVLIFGSTCLKTELAIRGRAVGGALQLRLGSQFVELTKRDG